MSFDVVGIGELLIDFTDNGISNQGNPTFEANPGGAPCNVLSMLTNFNRKVAFIGKVGNDNFGHMLKKVIEEVGISSNGLRFDDDINTTLAFVVKKANGDRDFVFYRKPGADIMLNENEIDEEMIKNTKIFHYGSLSFSDEPARSATKKALAIAKKANVICSFDPNLREPLWNSLNEAKIHIDYGMKQADFLKISDNEIVWFTGFSDFDDGIKFLKNKYPNIKLICLTMGKDGSTCYYGDKMVYAEAFLNKDTIETTGAGDTFCACMLNFILDNGLDNCNENDLKLALTFANASASLITTKKGALRVMPSISEVNNFIEICKRDK